MAAAQIIRRRRAVPWRDRQGRLSWLKIAVLAGCIAPGAVIACRLWLGDAGPKPITEAIHVTGLWTIRFLLISLALSPARLVFEWPRAPLIRRIVGVTASCYALAHLSLYIVDQNGRLLTVVSEIIHRFYLTIGFVALLGLIALAATSTDGATRRMGKGWKRLHRWAYPIAGLGLLHYFIQTKANVGEPIIFAGLFLWLMLWRLLPARWAGTLWILPPLALAAALLAAGVEFAWYSLATGINAARVLAAEAALRFGIRPAQWVAISGAAIVALAVLRRGLRAGLRPRAAPSKLEARRI
ncbi:MAG TPA: protein-methionine-sulfoxide reductase heme-binding subunit MsrQ [Acetobacteraceae bacterium]|nr:protein-methionine-sulfoxide reductase heme-binding subunit MsrQ [Acetobacteraceae bacterium]